MPGTKIESFPLNLIFDWSGTLADDFNSAWKATNFTLAQFGGKPLTQMQFRRDFNLPVRDFYQKRCKPVPMRTIETTFKKHYDKLSRRIQLFPDFVKGLEKLSQQHRLFILSSTSEKAIKNILREKSLLNLFEDVYGNVSNKIPFLTKMIGRKKMKSWETLFVGDMEHDLAAARHAKIQVGAALYGYTSIQRLQKWRPEFSLSSPGEAVNQLLNLGIREKLDYPIATVGGLLFNAENKALFVKTVKWSGFFGTPGGKVEQGETLETAFKREMLEETGLRVTNVKFVMIQDCIDNPEFYTPKHFILVNYIGKTKDKKVTLNYEGIEYKWWTLREALSRPLNQPTTTLVKKILENKLKNVG